MIVYIYDKKTNEKKESFKNVYRISSNKDNFKIHDEEGEKNISKQGVKLVVYGVYNLRDGYINSER